MDATIDYLARALAALGDTDSLDTRRSKAMLVMANPLQALRLLQTFAAHRTRQPTNTAASTGQPGTTPDTWTDPTNDPADDPHPTLDDTADAGAGNAGEEAADPTAGFTRRFRPGEIHPDEGFRLGFDPKTLLPRVTLYLHLYTRTDTGQIGPVTRWEGEGPISTAYVRDILGPAASFTIKPVLDSAGMAPVDGYEIPDAHREAVHLRTPADCFPYAANTTRRMQIDHTRPYIPPDHGGPPGQTAVDNLAPLTRFHHRIKTHGAWQVRQPFPGIYLWADPHGHIYLVDHTGTRPLGKTTPAQPDTQTP
jgi:hypothetical protein